MEQKTPERNLSDPLGKLLLFTRYPEPGTAKTRLIPTLGAVGAAALSRQMTEHTLTHVQTLQHQHAVQVEIRFAGGSVELMQHWLGPEWNYVLQGPGNLGDRLLRSLESAYQSGASRIVIIGTDCPELDAALLHRAFVALVDHDLVLGPAVDGGYYLIGVRRLIPELFTHIAWSTAAVLSQTMTVAQQLGLTIALLPPLSDVDYPADLAIWQRVNPSTPVVPEYP